MGIYDILGVTPIINAAGTLTRVGGSRMAPEVLAAMNEAAASFVHIGELQERAGEAIAEITGAEAGYVVTGAAAGLALGIAACIAGNDLAKMDALPDTGDLPYEVVVQKGHRNAYDHAIRSTGATFVEVGTLGYPGAGGTMSWQVEAAITPHTVAIACPIMDTPGTLSLAEIAAIAHAYNLPVVVDAAAELPPRSNLRRFISEGADIVVFSGGKAIGGPQASGVMAGRRDLIASVALQHQDMDVRPETWNRRDLITSGAIRGVPTQGFGRAMKVGREEIAGLIVALQRFAAGDDHVDARRYQALLDIVEERIGRLPGVSAERDQASLVPKLWLDIDAVTCEMTAYDLVNLLLGGPQPVAVSESFAEHGRIGVISQGLTEEEAAIVGESIRRAITGGSYAD